MAERPLPAYDGGEAYVFVTYAHEDADHVYPHIRWLQDEGFNVWWDEGISPGAAWRAELAQAIRGCSLVVFFVTPNSVASEHCTREVNFALDEFHRPVLAVHLIETTLPDALALSLSDRQAILHYASPQPEYDRKLATALATYLDQPLRDPTRPGPATRSRRPAWLAGVAGLGIGALAASLLTWMGHTEHTAGVPLPAPPVRAPFPLEGWIGPAYAATSETTMAVAASGDRIAYIGVDEDGRRGVRVRSTDSLTSRSVAGTEDTSSLFFSPDGASIGIFRSDELERVSVDGGSPITIVSFAEKDFWGASWGEEDDIVYAVGRSGLKRVFLQGGDAAAVTELDDARNEGSHRYPHHIAGYDVVLFTVLVERTFGEEVWSVNLSTGERRYLFDGSAAFYVSSGHVVFARGHPLGRQSLWVAPFDAERMEVTGPATLIQSGVARFAHAVARSGLVVYLPFDDDLHARLVLLEAEREPRVIGEAIGFESPRFANDGRRVAVTRAFTPNEFEIGIYDLDSGADYQFTEASAYPLWDSDDRGITFTEIPIGLVHQRLNEPGSRKTLVSHPQMIMANAWINEGKSLVYTAVNPETESDVYVLQTDGRRDHIYGRGAGAGAVTRDDQWLALCTWPRGILVGKLPQWTSVSTASEQGCAPTWGQDGSKLYYQDHNRLWTVDAELTSSGVAFGEHNVVAELAPGFRQYDVAGDGRIVLVESVSKNQLSPVLLLNWWAPTDVNGGP